MHVDGIATDTPDDAVGLDEKLKAEYTRILKISVALGVAQFGKNSARQMVPEFALGADGNMATLAQEIGETRRDLSRCLGIQQPKRHVRRALESYLELTPGGMDDILSVLEAL